MNKFRAAFALAFLVSISANAEVWRCTDTAGHSVYQSAPCDGGKETGIQDTDEPIAAPYEPPSWQELHPSVRRDANGHIIRSEAAKDAFKKANPCPSNGNRSGPCPGYVIDHIQALACGGADAPSNMQWQTAAEGHAKDAWERDSCATGGANKSGKPLAIENVAGQSSTGSTYRGYASGVTYTGPRGGRYHFSASGNKVYEKRK